MLPQALHEVLQDVENVAKRLGRPAPRLLAVSKQQPAGTIRALAELNQTAFGENYVQEAQAKQAALADLPLEWHLIGHLQSNKAAEAARAFDWIQSVDRHKLVAALARHRSNELAPLQVLVQVNIDDEASKHGCRPQEIGALADAIAVQERLQLRGLMAIPAARPDPDASRPAFGAMKTLFDALARTHAGIDTLSLGMSADYRVAIEEGATLVRVGSKLFGARAGSPRKVGDRPLS